MQTNRPSRGLIVATFGLLCLIWGTTWKAIQISLEGIPPMTGIALRFGLAAAILLGLARLRGVRLGRSADERRLWWINAVLSFAVPYSVVYWGEQWVPSGVAAVLFAPYPLCVALVAHFALPNERLRRLDLVGIAVGFGGVAVIFSEDLSALGGPQVALASAVMLLSPIAASLGTVATKRWGAGLHPFSITAVPMALTAVATAALALAWERGETLTFDTRSVGSLVYLTLAGTAVTFTLYYWLLEHLPAKRLSLIAYVVPVVAVVVGMVLGEPITGRVLGGAAMVVGGVALSARSA